MKETEASSLLNEFEFSRKVEEVRCALHGYVFSLLLDRSVVDEVFQDTLLFLWNHRADFEPESNFRAWAFKAAYFKALARRRDLKREKWVYYSDEMFEQIAVQSENHASETDERLRALRMCVGLLAPEDAELLHAKYSVRENLTTRAIEAKEDPNKLHKTLSRIRIRLRSCILKHLKESK